MGFPHCPICLSVAFLTACITVTRSYMLYLLYKESVNRRFIFLPIWLQARVSFLKYKAM